jgi:hypothetical protein
MVDFQLVLGQRFLQLPLIRQPYQSIHCIWLISGGILGNNLIKHSHP